MLRSLSLSFGYGLSCKAEPHLQQVTEREFCRAAWDALMQIKWNLFSSSFANQGTQYPWLFGNSIFFMSHEVLALCKTHLDILGK